LGGAEVFVNERLGGTLRRLVITPTRKAVILAGKCLGRFTLGLTQMALLVGFGALVLGVNWGNNPWALLIMLVAFGLTGTALGVMLGAFARTRSQASGLTILFSMLLAALGGAWWPLEITPQAYQNAVSLLPSTWAMRGFTDVIVRGQGVSAILPEAGILLGFAVLFFVVGIWKLKFE
jgi:ABC-2 type transport system permease protein